MTGQPETFIQYFSRTVTKARVVLKKDSWLMWAVAYILAFLTKLKIVDFPVEKFMERYTTVLGHTIYSGHMTMDTEPNSLVVHELTHILQRAQDGIKHSLKYLFSKKYRATAESEACQASMLLSLESWTDTRMQNQATKLAGYGCDYNYALSELAQRKLEVVNNTPMSRPARVHLAVTEWRAECAA